MKVDANVVFKTIHTTQKLSFRTNMKDRTPKEYCSNVVYQFTCPGCNASYIGKTERNLSERCKEHATTRNSAIGCHFYECEEFQFITNLMEMDGVTIDKRAFLMNTVNDNTRIIDSSDNWNVLLVKEALHIKRNTPILNNGLKASRDLYLFN